MGDIKELAERNKSSVFVILHQKLHVLERSVKQDSDAGINVKGFAIASTFTGGKRSIEDLM